MKRKQKTQTQSFAQIKKNENKNNVQIVQIDFQNSCTFTYKLIKKKTIRLIQLNNQQKNHMIKFEKKIIKKNHRKKINLVSQCET